MPRTPLGVETANLGGVQLASGGGRARHHGLGPTQVLPKGGLVNVGRPMEPYGGLITFGFLRRERGFFVHLVAAKPCWQRQMPAK